MYGYVHIKGQFGCFDFFSKEMASKIIGVIIYEIYTYESDVK